MDDIYSGDLRDWLVWSNGDIYRDMRDLHCRERDGDIGDVPDCCRARIQFHDDDPGRSSVSVHKHEYIVGPANVL